MKLKTWITALTIAAAAVGAAGTAQAQQFFRIGTGGTAGTYYPIGGIIANAVSQPGKLVATAVASNGSVANINGILGGSFEAGFTQSDVAFWAYSGTGTFEGKPKAQDLRLIATLYPESIHLVARKGAGIKSVADLKGKRVSMDEPGSGTLVDVRLILGAYGMTDKDIKATSSRMAGWMPSSSWAAPPQAPSRNWRPAAPASKSCPWLARRSTRCAPSRNSSRPTPLPPTPTRTWVK
jgi:TRAP transporter TAXI family solute receptor